MAKHVYLHYKGWDIEKADTGWNSSKDGEDAFFAFNIEEAKDIIDDLSDFYSVDRLSQFKS